MVMAGVMALGMVGCGSTAAEAPAESTVPAAESTAAETTESTAEAQTETADAQTEAGRQFVVGFDAEFPPYGYKDDSGKYVGFDLDLAQEAVPVELVTRTVNVELLPPPCSAWRTSSKSSVRASRSVKSFFSI